MRPPNIVLGGPCYRMELDARHAGTFGMLALALHSRCASIAWKYQHGNPVSETRNSIMATLLDDPESDIFVSMDSDSYFLAHDIPTVADCIIRHYSHERVLAGFASKQRDGRLNVWTGNDGGQRYTTIHSDCKPIPVHAIGAGCLIFNLSWYREHWPNRFWFRDQWSEEDGGCMSEDYWHCRTLANRHHVSPLWIGKVELQHADRGHA